MTTHPKKKAAPADEQHPKQEVIVATAVPAQRPGMTPEQVDLIRRTLCKDATNDELELFILQCNRTGLDPFNRQIHAVKRGGKLTIQIGIDGLRLIADRTGQTDGQEGPFWCGEDGLWRDVWLDQKPPAACKVTVFRKGQARGYAGVARFSEFVQQGPMWQRLPSTMLAKVAESIALRKAFPAELSGLYAPEEIREEPAVKEAEPLPAPLPPPGVAFLAGMTEYDIALTKRGLCKGGDLILHVASFGKQAKFPPSVTAWGEAEVKVARGWVAAFEREALVIHGEALMDQTSWSLDDVRTEIDLPAGAGKLADLSLGQLRETVGLLEGVLKAEAA